MGENTMNVLITGEEGFIGKHLVDYLYGIPGYRIFGYDLLCRGQDIRDPYELDKAFEAALPDVVIHLAARAGVARSAKYPGEYLTTNIEGTYNVGKMCEKYQCDLISFSSSSVFGNGRPPINENVTQKPISFYGMTKSMGEQIVNNLNVPTVIVRPFSVYGPKGRPDMVFYKWINQYKAGRPVTVYDNMLACRGYTYVTDLCWAVQAMIETKIMAAHRSYNIGGNEIIHTSELLDIFSDALPGFSKLVRHMPPPATDIVVNYADISAAKRDLGYDPPKVFRENLKHIIESELEEA
jgi:UDP-glucuronate 4-epimerase